MGLANRPQTGAENGMMLVGIWKANHDCTASFLGTFMGGAIFSLAAAGPRLLILSQGKKS